MLFGDLLCVTPSVSPPPPLSCCSQLRMPPPNGSTTRPRGFRAGPTAADGKPDLSGLWRLEPKVDPTRTLDEAGPQPWVVDAAKKFMHELGRDDTGVLCLPSGPRATTSAPLVKFVQTPAMLTMLY